jgi:hypothetical protein
MPTQADILSLLTRANAHEAKAGSFYQLAKQAYDDDERDHYFEQEREEASAARALRAEAWALVQADPTLRPPGVDVPEQYLPGTRP